MEKFLILIPPGGHETTIDSRKVCSYYIDGIEMSEIHPRWNTLLKWLQQRGMNTNSIPVEARRTEGEC